MLFKKKPDDKGAAEVVSGGGFGLFVERPKSTKQTVAAPSGGLRPRPDDVIDVVEVVREETPRTFEEDTVQEVVEQPAPESIRPSAFSGISIKKKAPETTEEVPASRAPEKKPLFGGTRKREDKAVAPDKAETKGGFFSRTSASKATEAAKPVKAAKPFFGAKGSKKTDSISQSQRTNVSPNRAKPAKSVDILVELEGGREVFWRITAEGLEEISADEAQNVVSFTSADYRLHSDAPLTDGAAMDFVLSEKGETVRLINRTKEHGAIYATPAQRVNEKKSLQLSPGLLAVTRQLGEQVGSGTSLLCGLVLKDESSGRGLVILYYFSGSGEVTPVQVTANADNVSFIIAQFAATNRLDLESTKATLLANSDLLKGAATTTRYPLEAEFLGVGISKLAAYSAGLVMLGAAASVAYAAEAYISMSSAQAELKTANATKKSLKSQLDAKLLASVNSFTLSQSVDLQKAFDKADAFWIPGTRMTLSASPGESLYSLKMPLTPTGTVGAGPSVLGQLDMTDVSPMMSKEISEGCVKSAPSLTGALNVIQISITCKADSNLFSSYWPK